jgi:hypothetical protein
MYSEMQSQRLANKIDILPVRKLVTSSVTLAVLGAVFSMDFALFLLCFFFVFVNALMGG